MNERTHNPGHDSGDAALRLALRGLRQDRDPGSDLWPDIEARIHALPQASAPVTANRRWAWPLAMAASMLLALGLARQEAPESVRPLAVDALAPVRAAPLASEAEALTLHYQAALRELDVRAVPASWQPGLEALDHGAGQVLAALRHSPQSPQLLERLRQIYARRLALSRRALFA